MRASEIRELIRVKPVERDATRRRLSACHDVDDLRATGRRLIPRPVFDYVDGGADEELSLRANVRAFRQFRFQPRALVDVSEPDTAAAFLGSVAPLPLALAPTGYTRMMHPGGEIAAARAAQRHGLPYTLSTMATTTIEAVAENAQPDLWFQLYILRDRGLSKELVDRAAAAGYRVLVVTVDCFVTGHRSRDPRNGLVIPPELTARTLASIAGKPGYWMRMLRNPAIDFANFAGHEAVTIEGTGALFNPAITWDDIAELRARWPGRLVVKGPLGPRTRPGPSRWEPTAYSCPTTADASWTGRCRRSPRSPPSGTWSGRTSACWSTRESGTARTSRWRWPSARTPAPSGAPTCTG